MLPLPYVSGGSEDSDVKSSDVTLPLFEDGPVTLVSVSPVRSRSL